MLSGIKQFSLWQNCRIKAAAILLMFAATGVSALAAEDGLPGKDAYIKVSGVDQPYAGYALREDKKNLQVIIRIGSTPADAAIPAVTLAIRNNGERLVMDKPENTVSAAIREDMHHFTFAVPLKMINAKREFSMSFSVSWPGGPEGKPLRIERYMDTATTGLYDGISDDPALWRLVNIDQYNQAVDDARSLVHIQLNQPLNGKLTLVIEDKNGNRIRNLLGGEARSAGELAEVWDGLDDSGNLVKEGEYHWRAVHHPGLVPEYLMCYSNGGEQMLHPFGSNHGTFSAAAADDNYAYLAAPITEGGWAMIAVDADGNWKKGFPEIHGTGYAAVAVVSDGKVFYSFHEGPVPGQEQPRGSREQAQIQEERYGFNITRYNIESGRTVDYSGGRSFFWLETEFTRKRRDAAGLRGVALLNGVIYLSSLYNNEILVIDPATAAIARRLPLAEPGALTVQGDKLIVVSGRTLIELDPADGKTRKLIDNINCGGLYFSAADRLLFVSDVDSHTVKAFEDGKLVREYGKPGGAYKGNYDPYRLVNPSGIVARHGRLWITENGRWNPKRVSMWDVKSGKILREKFGNAPYGGDGAGFDHANPTRFIGLRCEWEIDLKNKAENCLSILQGPASNEDGGGRRAGHLGGYYGQAYRYRYHHEGGRRFLVGAGFINIVSEFQPDGSLRDIAALSTLHSLSYGCGWRPPQSFADAAEAYLKANNIPYKDLMNDSSIGRIGVFWRDLNGDGLCDENEFQFTPPGVTLGGTRWGHVSQGLELQIPVLSGEKQGILRMKPRGWATDKLPDYPTFAEAIEEVAGVSLPAVLGKFGSLVGAETATDRFGNTVFNSDINMVCTAPDGSQRWFYPNQWRGVHGSHKAPLPQVGVMQGNLFFLGIAPLDDTADVFVLNGNHGRFFALSSDGMYLDEMFRDVRMGGSRDEMWVSGEPFGGFFARSDKDGNYYLLTGNNGYRIYRLSGLDKLSRSQGTVRVDAQQLMSAERRLARRFSEQSAVSLALAGRMDKALNIDGDDRDWGTGATLNWGEPEGARARIAYDQENLYLFYNVTDSSPWVNNGTDWQSLFKTGDSVDLQIGLNPDARANRNEPTEGDVRLLIAPFGEENIAVLYRHRLADKTEATPVTFTSPWRSEVVDDVRRLENATIAVRKESGRCRVEVAVPLKDLGLSFESLQGRKLQTDFGFILGDREGTINMRRAYWSNQATGLVNDVPGEIMLNPSLWGTVEFK